MSTKLHMIAVFTIAFATVSSCCARMFCCIALNNLNFYFIESNSTSTINNCNIRLCVYRNSWSPDVAINGNLVTGDKSK